MSTTIVRGRTVLLAAADDKISDGCEVCSNTTQLRYRSVTTSVCSVRIVETLACGWHTRRIARRSEHARPSVGEISRKPYESRLRIEEPRRGSQQRRMPMTAFT